MPYAIKKKDDEFCVHKADKDDKPMGESLGCHSSRKKAGKQIGAIEAAEEEKMSKKSVQKASLDGDTSIEDSMTKVSRAWYSENDDYNTWIAETFDDFVIIWSGNQKTHFQVGLSISGDDISFAPMNEWVEVKLKEEWITKSIERLGLQDLVVVQLPEKPDSGHLIKTLGGNRIGAYGILWGDETHRDLHKEFFTPDTKDIKAVFDVMGAVPNVVHHGVDDTVEKFVVGAVDVMEADDKGVWWESKIKEFEVYREYVEPLLNEETLFSSSGVLPGAKRVSKDTGEITRWPVVEMTNTWLPAEYRMLENPISDIKAFFKTIGIEFDETVVDVDPDEAAKVAKGVEKARLNKRIQQELLNIALAELETL